MVRNMKKLFALLAITLVGVALFVFSKSSATPVTPIDVPEIRPVLTPTVAQAAIVDLIRSKRFTLFEQLDADEWGRKEIKDEGNGTWSLGGLFYFTPEKSKFAFTVFPRPGASACAITYEGAFKLDAGKWVAQSPEVKSYAMMRGN
jgi:hypothetical protein